MRLLATVSLDVSIVLALALVATWLLRGRSAATRHWILATALACAAVIPVVELIIPAWHIPVPAWLSPGSASTLTLTSSPAADGSTVLAPAPAAASVPSILDRPEWLILGGWLSGVAAALIMLLTGFARLGRLRRRARVITRGRAAVAAASAAGAYGLRRPVLLLQSDHPALVVTWGLLRPRVLLPSSVEHWSDDRLRVVLSHELAHVRRGDWSLQILASLLQSVYWFNPLVWLACRQLRLESERACDDAVLSSGIAGSDYAAHLLAVARDAVRLRDLWTPANAIAHPSTLERRIRAMLNLRLNRAPLTAFTRYAVVFTLGVLTVAVSSAAVSATAATIGADVALAERPQEGPVVREPVQAPARPRPVRTTRVLPAAPATPAAPPLAVARGRQQAPATFSGIVIDASGGVLPGVEITLTDTIIGSVNTAVSDGAGRFTFRDLPPSRYELVAKIPGFANVNSVFDIAAGAALERQISMRIGSLQETLTVTCGRAAALGRMLRGVMALVDAPVSAQEPANRPLPIRVGGQIAVPRMIKTANPLCPQALVAGTTVVNLEGMIGTDGFMQEVRQLPSKPGTEAPAEYVEAALVAVRQWQYTPTRLNNVPVPVIVAITIAFTR